MHHAGRCQKADIVDKRSNATSSKCTAGKPDQINLVMGSRVVVGRNELIRFADMFCKAKASRTTYKPVLGILTADAALVVRDLLDSTASAGVKLFHSAADPGHI